MRDRSQIAFNWPGIGFHKDEGTGKIRANTCSQSQLTVLGGKVAIGNGDRVCRNHRSNISHIPT